MMSENPRITFNAPIWLYHGGKASWHFMTLPAEAAAQVRFYAGTRAGFGSVPVEVTIGATIWRTSLFPDKEKNSFLLPLKKEVREKERLTEGVSAEVTLALPELL